ncbi:MAG: phenylalanine--tRNA ligase subunit beta, partial [Candidatus Brennerbacteria bacterium CG_4_9_14_3_um_filter_43_9]
MLISLRVLKKYISLPSRVSAEDIKLKLTTSTVEVEKIETQGKQFEHIVVGRVTRIAKHPNADKLKLVLVSFGPGVEQKEVVCGGTNLHEGMLVAFAQVGAMVRLHGQGDLVKLEKATIRGIESGGMICSAGEIGLADMFSRAEGTCMKPVCEELAE